MLDKNKTPADYVGQRMRAMVTMRLPKGKLGPGDEFIYNAACLALGLDPRDWIAAHSVELIAPAPDKPRPVFKSEPVVKADPAKGGK